MNHTPEQPSDLRTKGEWTFNGGYIYANFGVYDVCVAQLLTGASIDYEMKCANGQYICDAVNTFSALTDENKRLREALEIYADKGYWNADKVTLTLPSGRIYYGKGKGYEVARAALEKTD